MTLEEVENKLKDLRQQRCDCVLSIRAPSTCWVCRDIDFYLELRAKLARQQK